MLGPYVHKRAPAELPFSCITVSQSTMIAYGLLTLIVSTAAVAREIVFPPIAAIQGSGQVPLGEDDTVDIVTGSQFSGLTTFGHLPYVNCLVDDQAHSTPYDIAILGAPFDTVRTAL